MAGLIGDVMIATDPKYELFDSIRGTESSSEARLSTVQRNLRDMTKHLAQKAHSLGANAIFGSPSFLLFSASLRLIIRSKVCITKEFLAH